VDNGWGLDLYKDESKFLLVRPLLRNEREMDYETVTLIEPSLNDVIKANQESAVNHATTIQARNFDNAIFSVLLAKMEDNYFSREVAKELYEEIAEACGINPAYVFRTKFDVSLYIDGEFQFSVEVEADDEDEANTEVRDNLEWETTLSGTVSYEGKSSRFSQDINTPDDIEEYLIVKLEAVEQ